MMVLQFLSSKPFKHLRPCLLCYTFDGILIIFLNDISEYLTKNTFIRSIDMYCMKNI
jgi:hypothetical protein